MAAIRPERSVLTGRYVRLEPQLREQLPELYRAIAHPEVFAGGFGGGPAGYRDTEEGFLRWAERYFAWDDCNVYAVKLVGGPDDGAIVGTTTLGDFDEVNEHAHIGWTAYDPRVWSTAVNPEAKLLLLDLAFESGFGRVKIQADVLNERSRAAIAKLGAQFEGIARRDRRRSDGSWRDSAIFSVIVDEWPRVREGLAGRVDAYRGIPVTRGTTDVAGTG